MPARIRNWYSVYQLGETEPSMLVSAFTPTGVKVFLKQQAFQYKYKIVPTKSWVFVKVMSGYPYKLPKPSAFASNQWGMLNDGIIYEIVILN